LIAERLHFIASDADALRRQSSNRAQ
jgi:hypothetical protein